MTKTLRPDFLANRRAKESKLVRPDAGPLPRSSRSQRRKRRQERRCTREQQSAVVLAAAHAFVAFDGTGVITDWNGQSESLFGWTRGEAMGRKLAALILSPECAAIHRPGLDPFLDGGAWLQRPGRIELTAVRRDGHRFPVEMSVFTFAIDGKPCFAAFLTDIAHRLHAEEELRHHDSVLRAVLEDSSDLVLAKDPDLKLLVANRTASRVLGQPVERLLGRSFGELMPRELARHIEENDRMVMRYARPLVFEEVVATPDGDRTFLVTKSPYRNLHGEIRGIIYRGVETTGRHQRKQAAARLERQLLERLHDSCVGISYGTLGASLMLDANDRYTHVFGRCRGEMVGLETAAMNVFADETDRVRMTSSLGRTGAFPQSHVTFLRKDGTRSPALFSLRLVEIGSRLVWVAMAIDARSGEPLRRELAEVEALAQRLGAVTIS